MPGQVPIITSVTPNTVDPGTTTPITVTGSGFEGGGVLVTGPGATVANVVIDPTGTIITFDLTLAADAPADSRQLIVVTENGIATCGILTSVEGPELLVASLLKTGSVFEVSTAGFRLVVFEFSINENFETGLADVRGVEHRDRPRAQPAPGRERRTRRPRPALGLRSGQRHHGDQPDRRIGPVPRPALNGALASHPAAAHGSGSKSGT